ncbi:SET domain-containing protein [Triangularia verruculosa]|uniref:SET domain-containing protein n=1 Tax=Triangularia verruculosa TaxID=2587418 RepID=A0AAN7AQU9_9PEZI|nr:SET domain-containing protein [Triangularia verruculosa]
MGFDCGFDIFPRLEATVSNKQAYQDFLDDIIETFGDVVDKDGRQEDGKILLTPTDTNDYNPAYIYFMIGECPTIPRSPDHCDCFLRFSSKVSGRLTAPAEPYLRSVYKITKRHFGSRVHWWHEMNETGDARQFGCYGWQEIHDAKKTLEAFETAHRGNDKHKGELVETTSTGSDATTSGAGEPSSSTTSASQSQPDNAMSTNDDSHVHGILDQTTSKPQLYAVRAIQGKGQGLIATSKIPKGTRILAEAPLFTVPPIQPDEKAAEAHIISQLRQLSKDQQRAFFALHNAHETKTGRPFLGISITNALPLGCQADECGVFLQASRINHSCRHNAANIWNANIGKLTIHALRDIQEGEEITISYLGRFAGYADRQEYLREKFSFDCKCELCSLPADQRRQSDGRLAEIEYIDGMLGYMGSKVIGYGKVLHLLRKMFDLFEEEGIWNGSVPRAYYDAFQLACMHGDQLRAKIFAERVLEARIIIEGDDSPEVPTLRKLAENPSLHGSYRMLSHSPKGIRTPKNFDGLEVDDWLWG